MDGRSFPHAQEPRVQLSHGAVPMHRFWPGQRRSPGAQRLSWAPFWMRAQISLTCSCSRTHCHASASRLNVFTTRDLPSSSVTWTSHVGLSFRGTTLYVTLIFALLAIRFMFVSDPVPPQ